MLKHRDYPNATRSKKTKKLMVGATIGTRDYDRERMEALAEAGVDVIVLDSSQGDSSFQYHMIKWLKENFPDVDVIGGNVVTRQQCKHLIAAGVDGLRVAFGQPLACGRYVRDVLAEQGFADTGGGGPDPPADAKAKQLLFNGIEALMLHHRHHGGVGTDPFRIDAHLA